MTLWLTLLMAWAVPGVRGQTPDFRCPEEFGYYPHHGDCSLYYVCVFGGPLLESCTGGLVYSQDLQTCDWPRNVPCNIRDSLTGHTQHTDTENVNIAIESQKNTKTSSREPRLQSHSSVNKQTNSVVGSQTEEESSPRPVPVTVRKDLVAEILRNVDESVLDALSPQPSIVSVSTHGLERVRTPSNGITTDSAKDRSSSLSQQSSSSFGSREDDEAYVELYDDESVYISDTSEIEKSLLSHYPGVSKHLDDSHDGEDSEFYYTNWKDDIYDEFKDYEDISDDNSHVLKSEISDTFESIKETPVEAPRSSQNTNKKRRKDEILLDHRFHPSRPRRRNPPTVSAGSDATRCSESSCLLPDCRCGSADIPGNLTREQIPQLVILTFDDSINDLNQRLYQSIFHPIRRNPNGCPISATFYVSHEWTDYGHVQNMYSDGHEIGSHSISHSFGEQFSKKKWMKEIAGQREILAAYGGVHLEDIRGMRAPFLAIGGNPMFSMLHEANFTYDSSMPIYENKPPAFPYTLDYRIFHECMIPPCPTKSYPGLWELPLVMWNDHRDGRCSMADACSNPPDAEGVYMMILKNFERHYQTNRAPFGLFYHPAWFTTPHHKEGFELFLDTITAMEDVWLVTSWQAIQWMREPTPISSLSSFPPFQCDYKSRPPRCSSPKVCNLWHKSGVRYMRTCQTCPSIYPWTSRTGIANSLVDQL